jgi:hypothetical protein
MGHFFRTSLVILAMTAFSTGARGDAGCCEHCGCMCSCQKVCRLVCEEKKVEVLCWGCKCEDFCLPGPGCPGCKHCDVVCQSCPEPCDPAVPYAKPKQFVWRDWMPNGAQRYTRTKLMRKTETVTVPSYKWVVEDLCAQCAAAREASDAAPVVAAPAAPIHVAEKP